MVRFEIENFGLGWSVTNGDDFRIFPSVERAVEFANRAAREAYSNAQRQVWKSGRRKKCALVGEFRSSPAKRRTSARYENGTGK